MGEIRYLETYEQGTGKLLSREPFEVSDEQIAKEKRTAILENINEIIDDVKDRVKALEDAQE